MDSINAAGYFLESANRFPDRPALWVDGRTYSYRQLRSHVQRLADRLGAIEGVVCATLGERSLTAYCAPLACMIAGKIHVPLGASFPEARIAGILERIRPTILICDESGQKPLPGLLARLDFPIRVLAPEPDAEPAAAQEIRPDSNRDGPGVSPTPPGHDATSPASGLAVPDSAIAYVLFTSGSTGLPKGVAVGHKALRAYVDAVLARYPEIDEQQRCTQFFEPTFDLSMHDMFVTWAAGACLYSVPRSALLMPTDFVNEHRLTVWFSVPSLPATLQRYRLLNAAAFPTLRLALFCGEALPGPLAGAFVSAAPNARCENLYGPTEATIACTAHRIQARDAKRSVIPIGKALAGMEVAVVRDDGTHCDVGETGELWLGGAQLAFGYWHDSAQTDARFVTMRFPALASTRWYRTGDLAAIDVEGSVHFNGRADRQVKLRGYRIELQEVEAHLRDACSHPDRPAQVAVVAVSADGSDAAAGLAAFVVCERFDPRQAMAAMKSRLPAYMVPNAVHALDALPLNGNGKVDYPALTARARAHTPGRRNPMHASATYQKDEAK